MYYQYPLEALARMRGAPSQRDFACEAALLVIDTDEVIREAGDRGLALFAAHEQALSQPARVLGDVFGSRVELRRPRVRRMPGDPSREPVMHVEIDMRPEYAGRVLAELRARGVTGLEECRRERRLIVRAEAPLAALLGLPASVAAATHGEASCSIRLIRYALVNRRHARRPR